MTFTNSLLAVLFWFGATPAASACAFHSALEVQLEGMYPGSLSVAVALRKAADSGLIDGAAFEEPGKRNALYIDSVKRLQQLTKTIAVSSSATELPASFSLGYVESRLWSRFTRVGGKVHAEIHTDGPAEGEAVVLTGEPVMLELLAGRLSLERALADGMILIKGEEIEKSAIRRVFDDSSMAHRISSR